MCTTAIGQSHAPSGRIVHWVNEAGDPSFPGSCSALLSPCSKKAACAISTKGRRAGGSV